MFPWVILTLFLTTADGNSSVVCSYTYSDNLIGKYELLCVQLSDADK